MLLLLIGCAARQQGDALTSVAFRFEGKRGEPAFLDFLNRPNARAIKNAMAHTQPTFQASFAPGLVEPAWLDRETLDTDGWRVEVWYANQGYFDARFLGWEVLPAGAQRHNLFGRPRKMIGKRVIGHIAEGRPSRVRTISVRGIDRLGRPLQNRLASLYSSGSLSEIAKGDVFSLASWDALRDEVASLLQERSYAHTVVTGRVSAYPEEFAVDLNLDVSTGPPSKFGAVTFDGLVKVPEAVVRDLLEIETGAAFSLSAIEKTRARLYSLRVFAVVDVIPTLVPGESTVPVTIHVTEAKFRSLKAGPILTFETGVSSVAAHAVWEDNNVSNRLWRMKQDTMVGAGVVIDSLETLQDTRLTDIKPIATVEGVVELPHIFLPTLSLLNAGRVEVGIEPNQYRYFSPQFTPWLVYTGVEDLRIAAGYRLEYTDYFEIEDLGEIQDQLDFKDPDLLSALEQKITYDGRNDPVATTRGWYWLLGLTEAGGVFGGSWTFLRATGEIRAWRGIVEIADWDPDIVFAGRLGGGVALPYGPEDEAAISLKEKLYLGGSNSVRGWGSQRLGPYACTPGLADPGGSRLPDINEHVCNTEFDRQVPIGGELQMFGNVEVRKGLPLGLTAAVFVDAGQVWAKPADFDASMIQFSLGAGLRYSTPVGPLRFDVARRMGGWRQSEEQLARFSAQPGWGLHLSLAEAF